MAHQLVKPITAVDANRRRGGEIYTLLSPTSVGSSEGFMGVLIVRPGESVSEHYHPYSEEFFYVTNGELEVRLNDVWHTVSTGHGLFVPKKMRHRIENRSATVAAEAVFALANLAPRPELGHVDTES